MTLQRVLTAAVMVPVVVGVVWFGPTWVVAAVVAVVAAMALIEFYNLGQPLVPRYQVIWSTLCTLWLMLEQWSITTLQTRTLEGGAILSAGGAFHVPLEVVVVVFALGAGGLALRESDLKAGVAILGKCAAGFMLVALPLSFLVRIHGVERYGRILLLFTLVVIWVGDSVAYFVGRAIGRMPMAPVLSPKKTWEGAAGNLLGSLLAGIPFVLLIWREDAATAGMFEFRLIVMAGVANVAGQVGDLVESAYKRAAGVKDSGAILPGHGGVLDRVDSLIFAAPAVWCYVWFVLNP